MTTHYLPHILLIDDDEDDRDLFTGALTEVSPRSMLATATGCEAALSGIGTGAIEIPDVVFLDLTMPGVSGFECVMLIKAHPKLNAVPIVVMSSAGIQAQIDRLYAMGVTYFITKPPTFAKLKEIIDKMVNTPAVFEARTKETFFANKHG